MSKNITNTVGIANNKSKYIIKQLIIKNDIEELKETYEKTLDIMKIVDDFIIKKKLLLYGGFAINLLLHKKDKFYKEYTINDYDCYSSDAQKDAYEISNIFHKKKYQYIQVKKALHENTFRVYVNFIQILDITNISKELYDKLFEITLNERKSKLYRYYKNFDYYLVPIILLKRNLHYELSRPKGSSYRWEKVYTRLKLLNNLIIDNKKTKMKKFKYIPIPKEYNKSIKILLKYIKDNNYPIIDSYAFKLYKNLKDTNCCRIHEASNFIIILSTDYKKTTKEIIDLLKSTLDNSIYDIKSLERTLFTEIMNNRNRVVITNKNTNKAFTIINIVDNNNDCLSIFKKNGYCVGSIDTILYYLYSIYIIYNIFSPNKNVVKETMQYILMYENYITKDIKSDVDKRLSTICYGNHIGKIEINKKNWKKTNTIYYPEDNI